MLHTNISCLSIDTTGKYHTNWVDKGLYSCMCSSEWSANNSEIFLKKCTVKLEIKLYYITTVVRKVLGVGKQDI